MTTQNIKENEIENFIYLQALENALSFNGQANIKPIFGKTISTFPRIKEDLEFYKNLINNIVKQVNEMNNEEQKKKLLKFNPNFFKESQEKKSKNVQDKTQLIDLPQIPEKFIGRFAPAPSGHLHIGHISGIVFNYEYKKKYDGKFILRIEDTNPDNIKLENYDKIIEDVKWLTDDGIDEIYYQSDRIDIYYKYLRQLIQTGYAYVCECDSDTFKVFNDSSQACPHRDRDIERQTYLFEKFFREKDPYQDGQACIRFKGDLNNKNPALRDFPIARLNSNPHPRTQTKYKLWPMYNFAVSIDDNLMGITYIIRGKDSEINAIRQDMIKKALGFKTIPYYHFGRIQFSDIELGKTPIKKKIEEGIYTGWDDPRVPTLISFKKRGFKAKAFRDMIINMGISNRDRKMLEKEYFKSLNYFNKQILEKESNRRFFIVDPKIVIIKDITKYPQKEIILPKHPEYKERGNRKFPISNKYYIDKIDWENINKFDIIRLMHFANFKVIEKNDKEIELEYLSKDFDRKLKLKRNIHFLPTNKEYYNDAIIIMQSAQKLKGLSENLDNPKINKSIQFERFGFVRFDSLNKNGSYLFYFTHR